LKVTITIGLVFLYSISLFSQTPGTEKWEYLLGDITLLSSPAIGSDGTIYTGAYDNKVYAFNQNGTKKWEFSTGNSILSSPAIGSDGTIYIGSIDKKLYAINPDGTKKWEFLTDNSIHASPALGTDGTVYISSMGNDLYAINPDGTQKWKFATIGGSYSSPSIGQDGTIYILKDKLYAINPDGTKKWEYSIYSDSWSSPAIGPDGIIYVSSLNNLWAFNQDGSVKYMSNLPGQCSSPAIGSDGTIYICSSDSKLYAFKPDGTKKWEFISEDGGYSSCPAIGDDGTIYFGSKDNNIYAINSDGTKKWEFLTGSSVYSSPSIGSNGIIFVGSGDKKFYAIYSSSTGLAKSTWPCFRHDNLNNGRFTDLIISNNDFSNMVLPNQSYGFKVNLENTFLKNITLTNVHFSESGFVLNTTMPVTFVPGIKKEISISLSAPQNRWYKPKISMDYVLDGVNYVKEANLEGIIFLNDNTELANTANRVMPVWKSLDKSNEVLLNNTKGIIYRLLSDYPAAEKCFNTAVSKAINDNYGYAGIMMNTGVVKSDRIKPDSAIFFYTNALNAVQPDAVNSVLAPQIYYNQAWEEFGKKNYPLASGLALSTINHPKSNDYIKAKANTLLGAIKFSEEKYNEAKDAFNMAIILDSNGPIGEMARENLALTNSVGIEEDSGNTDIRVYPNPSAGELFISTDIIQGKCSISIFNITGEKVYSDEVNSTAFSPLRLDLSRLSDGLYYIQLILPDKVCIEKVILNKK
jgi:outer membrane protein assembly factor BamB/tetratricopeptide (TPR) repeat protein